MRGHSGQGSLAIEDIDTADAVHVHVDEPGHNRAAGQGVLDVTRTARRVARLHREDQIGLANEPRRQRPRSVRFQMEAVGRHRRDR